MAWHINPDVNEGYPYEDSFPETFNTDWDTVTVPLPQTAWRQVDGVNEDYPFTGLFPERFNTNWKYDSLIPMPYIVWRIDPSANEGYPTLGWPSWGENAGGGTSDGGGMVIGGSRSNYPNGFRSCNRGGILGQFNNNSMRRHATGSDMVLNVIDGALAGRHFFLTGTQMATAITTLNNLSDSSAIDRIASMYGVNVYDGFLCCKAYPFILGTTSVVQVAVYMFGQTVQLLGPVAEKADSSMIKFEMGSADLDINQAWEVESTDYSIYLPFAGVFPLDIRNGLKIKVTLFVDLFNGLGEYVIYQNDQIMAIHKCQLGVDVPVNLNQGIMNSNLRSNIISTVSQGLPVAAALAGGALGGSLGSQIGGTLGGMAASAINSSTQHHQIQSPQVGGMASLMSYPDVRILAKVPKMWGDARGFAEIQGENRSMTFESLNSCSGFVQTKNYKCDIIVATDEEKQEIERLMNGGVFL